MYCIIVFVINYKSGFAAKYIFLAITNRAIPAIAPNTAGPATIEANAGSAAIKAGDK
jgi:hypothetical protein